MGYPNIVVRGLASPVDFNPNSSLEQNIPWERPPGRERINVENVNEY